MDVLLKEIKARLLAQLPYLRGAYILAIDELFPPEAATPAAGIRHGGAILVGADDPERVREDDTVAIDIFLENLASSEAVMLGDVAVKGLPAIDMDIQAALNDVLFEAEDLSIFEAYWQGTDPPVLFIYPDAGKEIIKQTLRFLYRRLRPR